MFDWDKTPAAPALPARSRRQDAGEISGSLRKADGEEAVNQVNNKNTISRGAYEFGWVVSLGACTVHSLAVSSAKDEFQAEALVCNLHVALKELVSKSLLRWEVWEDRYGDGRHHCPMNQNDTALFDSYWERFFGQKTKESDFWHDATTLKDVYEPTIEIEALPPLFIQLKQYES